jgi:single-strand DNA-binding protein
MAEGLNKVLLLGNLGADPELRMTPGGAAVLKFRLATSETFLDKNKQRQERTEWHNVVVWGRRAEALGRILTKGTRLFVEGGLRTSSYDDRDGNKRYRTEIVASNILLQGGGGGRGAGPGGGGGGGRDSHDTGYDPGPEAGSGFDRPDDFRGGNEPRGGAASYDAPTSVPDDDDIPF